MEKQERRFPAKGYNSVAPCWWKANARRPHKPMRDSGLARSDNPTLRRCAILPKPQTGLYQPAVAEIAGVGGAVR